MQTWFLTMCVLAPMQAMVQVTALASTFTSLNKAVTTSLKKTDAFGTSLAVSVPSFGSNRRRCPRIVVSRVTDTTTTSSTTNGSAASSEGLTAKALVLPGFTSVAAKIKVTRKPRLDRDERITSAVDVLLTRRGRKSSCSS